MEGFKKFVSTYRGAIIGALVAIVILCTRLYNVIVGIVIIALGIFAGSYVQKNKEDVKEKLKKFIDRI